MLWGNLLAILKSWVCSKGGSFLRQLVTAWVKDWATEYVIGRLGPKLAEEIRKAEQEGGSGQEKFQRVAKKAIDLILRDADLLGNDLNELIDISKQNISEIIRCKLRSRLEVLISEIKRTAARS